MRGLLVAVLLFAGLLLGFGATFALLPDADTILPIGAPVNISLSFSAREIRRESVGAGWHEPESWGVWSKDTEAVAFAQLLGRVEQEVGLFLEGRGRPLGKSDRARVAVLANGSTVGVWQLNGRDQDFASFTIPAEIVNREIPLRITFQSTAPVLGLRHIMLRDVSSSTGYAGRVDYCATTLIAGWAEASKQLSPIVVRRNGQVVAPTRFQNLYRPDLSTQGSSPNVGFEIELPQPSEVTATIDVLFPNGRPLSNSPCRPKL